MKQKIVERVRTGADFLSLGTDRIHSTSGTVPSTPSSMLSSGSSFMSEGHIVEPSIRRAFVFHLSSCGVSFGSCNYSR